MFDLDKTIKAITDIPYTSEDITKIRTVLEDIKGYVDSNHFLNVKEYLKVISNIEEETNGLSWLTSNEDRLLFRRIQRDMIALSRRIFDENKKIFIVHGRDIAMRDKVSSCLGKLKLEYAILESEHNGGTTVIEKFLRVAKDCHYAIVLFSADDIGKLESASDTSFKSRPRQNVILELGYFLSKVGRKNIIILHETDKDIEKPSDFDGIVYEAFDPYGAWKAKLVKELRIAGLFIDPKLADKV